MSERLGGMQEKWAWEFIINNPVKGDLRSAQMSSATCDFWRINEQKWVQVIGFRQLW